MKIFKTSLYILIALICISAFSGILKAQEVDEKNPKTFKHYQILANSAEDSLFVKVQYEMGISPLLESYSLIVNLPIDLITIGMEDDPTSAKMSFSSLSPEVQKALNNWSSSNKINLDQRKYNYASVFVDAFRNIKFKDVLSPPKKEREILSTTAYINPYLNFFGGEGLGIPLKKSFGFSFQLGTPYSGPLETDIISANFHLLGAKVGVTTRIKEFVRKRDAGATGSEKESTFGNYNNIFTPKLGLQASYVIPFGNFLEVGYFATLDSGDYDPPLRVRNNFDTVNNGRYMKNNVIVNKGFFNWEFRYPLRTFGSTRAKIYVAQYLGEFHAGYLGRELRLAGSVFDLRMDYMFGSQKRNGQFLWEVYISNIGESFGLNAFALGPSIRVTRGPDGGITVVTALLNARVKIGDFYDEK